MRCENCIGFDILPPLRRCAGRDELASGGNKTDDRFFDDGEFRNPSGEQRSQVQSCDRLSGADDGFSFSHGGSGGSHIHPALEGGLFRKMDRDRPVFVQVDIFDSYDAVESIVKIISGIGADIIDAGPPGGSVGKAAGKSPGIYSDPVHRSSAYDWQIILNCLIFCRNSAIGFHCRYDLCLHLRLPFFKKTLQNFFFCKVFSHRFYILLHCRCIPLSSRTDSLC